MENIVQGHVVAGGSNIANSRYATCIQCGGLAEMGFIDQENQFNYINGLYYSKNDVMIKNTLNLSYETYSSIVGGHYEINKLSF